MSIEVKKLKKLVESLSFDNWVNPDFNYEDSEFKRTARDLKLKYSFIRKSVLTKGFLVEFNDDLWRTCDNTSSFKINSLSDCNDYLIKVDRNRNLKRLIEGFKNNNEIPAPIVIIKSDNQPYLVGGNTRLMVSKALGIRPKVWLVFLV